MEQVKGTIAKANLGSVKYTVRPNVGDPCPDCGRKITSVDGTTKGEWHIWHKAKSVIPGVPQGTFCVVKKEWEEIE